MFSRAATPGHLVLPAVCAGVSSNAPACCSGLAQSRRFGRGALAPAAQLVVRKHFSPFRPSEKLCLGWKSLPGSPFQPRIPQVSQPQALQPFQQVVSSPNSHTTPAFRMYMGQLAGALAGTCGCSHVWVPSACIWDMPCLHRPALLLTKPVS